MANSPPPTLRSMDPPAAPCRPYMPLRTWDTKLAPISLVKCSLYDMTTRTWLGTVHNYRPMGGRMRIEVSADNVVDVSLTTWRVVDSQSPLFNHEMKMVTPLLRL